MQRSDAPLIKHIASLYGAETARDWQRPPLLALPDDGFVEYILSMARELDDVGVDAGRMPWADFVIDLRSSQRSVIPSLKDPTKTMISRASGMINELRNDGLLSEIQYQKLLHMTQTREGRDEAAESYGGAMPKQSWVRLRSAHDWMRATPTLLSGLWNKAIGETDQLGRECSKKTIVADMWLPWSIPPDYKDTAMPNHSEVVIIPPSATENWGGLVLRRHTCDDDRCFCSKIDYFIRQRQEIYFCDVLHIARAVLAYMYRSDEYLVEVKPADPRKPPRQQKVEQAKPNLREDLPHYILIDPSRAHEYGHPSAQRGPVGSHASPRPHTRRGHWAVLQSDRFERNADGTPKRVWRKQAWVGATEWTDGLNQRYRLVMPAVEEPVRRLALVT